jgi:pimeloyl-ACP methyl ester carboxylesterase
MNNSTNRYFLSLVSLLTPLIISFMGHSSELFHRTNPHKSILEGTTVPLAYTRTGNTSSAYRIIFIHGSPGDREAYEAYLNDDFLVESAELISIDRLGFGESTNSVETSLIKQAKAIQPFLSDGKNNVLVGHSLGSPIALQLALIEPNNISGMLLVASAFDPDLEQPKWYNQVANTIVARWILPEDMNNSNEEMMVLSEELNQLAQQDWSTLTMPIRLLHGDDDSLADPNNALFAYQKLNKNNTKLRYAKGEGHLILWQSPDEVIDDIKQLFNDMRLHD